MRQDVYGYKRKCKKEKLNSELMENHSTSYDQHGDYVFGWKGVALQNALDANCFGATCRALKTQSFADANRCAVPNKVEEQVEGCECFRPFPSAVSPNCLG